MISAAENGDSETDFAWKGRVGKLVPENEVARRDLSTYGSVTVAVIDALEAADATPPDSSWVLDDAVDTDSLEQLFAPKNSGNARSGGVLVFDAWGTTVVVTRSAVSVFVADAEDGPAVENGSL